MSKRAHGRLYDGMEGYALYGRLCGCTEGYVAVWKVMWLSGRLCGCLEGYMAVWLGNVAVWLGNVAVWLGFVAVWLGFVAVWLGFVAVWLGSVAGWLGSVAGWLGSGCLARICGWLARNRRSGEETPGIGKPQESALRTVPYRPLIKTFHMANDRPSEGPIWAR